VRFVLEKLYVRGGWRRVELLPPFRVIYSRPEFSEPKCGIEPVNMAAVAESGR